MTLDYPWVVATDESGHLSDFRETHESRLSSRTFRSLLTVR